MAVATAIELVPVTSSRLAAIGHDPETFTLAVKFPPTKKSPAGKIYHYANVSEEMFDDFKNAEIISVFFGQNILNNPDSFPFTCIDEGLSEALEISTPELTVPSGSKCEEASSLSRESYIACGAPATAIISSSDNRNYLMCDSCSSHNVHNRRAKILVAAPGSIAEKILLGLQAKGSVPAPFAPAEVAVLLPKSEIVIPEDEEGLKTFALATRNEVTAITISTAAECEQASLDVLRIRAERKLAIEKVNKIKTPATAAWKAACELFNEVDGRYAEAEKYLDGGILKYRADERRRAEAESARVRRLQEEAAAEARRVQQAELKRLQDEAQREADEKAAELAQQDAEAARAQGLPEEVVQAIIENPLPVQVRQVVAPPVAFIAPAQVVVQQDIPKVAGLGFTTEWCFEITDESAVPMSHDFYTLDPKKVGARVRSLKQNANIPGVRVWPEERSIKRTARG